MKQKNFPLRKNKRRKDAIARLNKKDELSPKELKVLENTQNKIMSDEMARNRKTKKHH